MNKSDDEGEEKDNQIFWMPLMKISTAACIIALGNDVATGWSHDTCKSADNCILLLFYNNTAFSHLFIHCSCFIIIIIPILLLLLPLCNNFREEKTRTSSPTTLHNESSDFIMEKQMQGIRATEEWTDEKHSMYIKSIEASFVNQLYDSKQTRASLEPATSSGQFKVHRGGCWQKIRFERENPQLSKINRSNDLTSNPWIQHYRRSSKQQSVVSPSLTSQVVDLGQRKGISSKSGQIHLRDSHVCHPDMLCDETEVSDQNFVDDEEVKGERENKIVNVKRQKSLTIDTKGNDQMVPFSKSASIKRC